MQKPLKINYIQDSIPVVYRYNQIVKWFVILLSFLMVVYSLYFMLNFVHAETPIFFKLMPLFICFMGLESILRKVTSLNSVTFMPEHLRLGYIAKPKLILPYDSIRSIDLLKKITIYITLSYQDEKGVEHKLRTPASFPHTLEIIFNLAEMAKQAYIPEKMQGVLDYLKASADNEL